MGSRARIAAWLLVGTAVAGPVAAQVSVWRLDWIQRTPSHSPPTAYAPRMVFDEARGRMVLHGPGTWLWDGEDWVEARTSRRPPSVGLLAYDSGRAEVVWVGAGPAGIETWIWDGVDWSRRKPATSPTAADAIAYDAARRRVVAVGGMDPSRTWLWDGVDWEVCEAEGPSARPGDAMAYDARRERTVWTGQSILPWEWDGSRWQTATWNSGSWLGIRSRHGMTYDPVRRVVVVAGGGMDFTTYPFRMGFADLWAWDGTTLRCYQPRSAPPGAGLGVDLPWTACAFDPLRARMVLFVAGQTWELNFIYHEWNGITTHHLDIYHFHAQAPQPINPILRQAAHYNIGDGCPGSAGTPSITSPAGGLPWIGEDFELELRDIPRGNTCVMWLGTSATYWQGHPLPLDLAVIGMPGCFLHASADIIVPLFNWTGTVRVRFRLPYDISMSGVIFYDQALVLDPGANAFGATVSSACRGLIGWR
jgi:hypothetical protein